jgi:hypothetical protein
VPSHTIFRYQFRGGPFEGVHDFARMLGEWVVLFADERQQPATAQDAFALVGYEQDGERDYRFRHCLTPALGRFFVEYADGPFQGSESSPVPALWLPVEVVRPLDAQARALRERSVPHSGAAYLAHYRRDCAPGNRYHLCKISRALPAEPGQAA